VWLTQPAGPTAPTPPATTPAPGSPPATGPSTTASAPQGSSTPNEIDGTWTATGYDITLTVTSVARTTNSWLKGPQPSITVTAYVTRSHVSTYSNLSYRISDQGSGSALDTVPFAGDGDQNPPQGQRSRIVFVVFDDTPPALKLTITVHDFFWPGSQNLVLRDIPVPPLS
jgi:hypothetical protein